MFFIRYKLFFKKRENERKKKVVLYKERNLFFIGYIWLKIRFSIYECSLYDYAKVVTKNSHDRGESNA